ncbi:MAG: hypothetical protein SGPRY_011851, partial [Prymnesium sp.]
IIVCGFRDDKGYLGTTDLYGTMYEDNYVATGLGAHMALPMMRKAWKEGMSEEEARTLLTDCMRVLFYRDTRASAKITIGKVLHLQVLTYHPKCFSQHAESSSKAHAAVHFDTYQLQTCCLQADSTGASVSEPFMLETFWEHEAFVKGGGYRGDGSW